MPWRGGHGAALVALTLSASLRFDDGHTQASDQGRYPFPHVIIRLSARQYRLLRRAWR
jgi:hypothetical protein